MVDNVFGGRHTQRKLETVVDYLNFYTTALKYKGFNLKYFDAFAGTGHMKNLADMPLLYEGEELEVMEGSTKRSLEINVPFAEYYFNEKSPSKVKKLEEMVKSYPALAPHINISRGDAVEELKSFCASLNWNDRAVIFLDPCGGQVTFEVLKIIAGTEKADLWYLFPSFLNVVRQVKLDNTVLPDAKSNIDALFGTEDWQEEFIKYRQEPDLFGMQTISEREINADAVTRYMIRRMNTIFKGGVMPSWLPLGKGKAQWYSLLFACANPSHAANSLAKSRAADIMRRK